MSSSYLLRRGIEYASSQLGAENQNQPDDGVPINVSRWVVGLFSVSGLALLLVLWGVEYTYGMLVSTLAAIEDTHPDIYVRIDSNSEANADEDTDPNKPLGHSVDADAESITASPDNDIQGRPVTNKLRTAINHLRARAGPWSRFRGLSIFLVYQLTQGILLSLFNFYSDLFISHFVGHLAINILLANLQLAWVHIVISEPSPKRWYQRIPGFKDWVRIAPVVAFQHLAIRSAFYLPLSLTQFFGGWDSIRHSASASATDGGNGNGGPAMNSACMMAATVVGPAILAIFVAIPVSAIFVRVAASMLPENHEAIVPFDRSFGGKVVPAILGGSGKVSIADAWRTFDWPARVRYFKVVGKALAIEVVVGMALLGVMVGQAYYLGPELVGSLVGRQ